MDLRDIQRLHAQFAPDMLTIDLPRQIAALPGPSNTAVTDVSPTMRRRWAQTGPLVRGSIIAVAVAALVGMAGMGAATIYKSLSGPRELVVALASAPRQTEPARSAMAPVAAAGSQTDGLKGIDATPAHPLVAAPGLDSSNLTTASPLGMTADEFRRSLKMGATPNQTAKTVSAPTQVAVEDELAAASPIHRNATRASLTSSVAATAASTARGQAPAQVATPPFQNAAIEEPSKPVIVQRVPQEDVAVSSALANTPRQGVAVVAASPSPTNATSATAVAKSAHPARRHVSKPRLDIDNAAEPNASARAVTPSVPASRSGSNEVQMF